MANIKNQRMSPSSGILIWLVVDTFGLGLFGGTGYALGNVVGLCLGVAVWVGIRLGNDLIINSKQDFVVIERFGRFYKIHHDGIKLLLLRGLIDRIPMNGKGTIAYVQLPIYKGDKDAEFDFRDGSAPVTASVWRCVGNPEDKANFNGTWDAIDDDIEAFTYAFEDGDKRLAEVVDGFVRPILQGLTIDDASTEKGASSTHLSQRLTGDETVKEALRELGIWLDPNRAFVLSDIDVPTDLQEARKRRLVAKANADADQETGRGIRGALNKIKGSKPTKGEDRRMSDKDAARIFETRVAQKVLEETKPDITLIGSDVGGLTKTLQVSDTTQQGSRGRGQQRKGQQ